jgi:hypothetical protein
LDVEHGERLALTIIIVKAKSGPKFNPNASLTKGVEIVSNCSAVQFS